MYHARTTRDIETVLLIMQSFCLQIRSIEMKMPNKHYFTLDLSKFPKLVQGENQEVYLPVDKPAGIIYAQLDRKATSSKL